MDILKIQDLEKEFINYLDELEFIKNLSKQTIKNYNQSIKLFIKYLKENNETFDDPLKSLKKYVIFLRKNKNCKQSTINSHIINISIFLNHLDITINTKKLMGRDNRKNKPIKYLESSEIQEVIGNIPEKNLRDKVIILTLYHTGLRVSELVKLNKNDITSTNNENVFQVKVIEGKGGKYRTTFLDKDTYKLIEKMIYERREKKIFKGENIPLFQNNHEKFNSENTPLFQSSHKKRISVRTIQRIVKKYAKIADEKRINKNLDAKYEKILTCHSLRHSYTINLLNNNKKPINMVQKLLGHGSIQTTQIYSNVAIDKIKEDYENIIW